MKRNYFVYALKSLVRNYIYVGLTYDLSGRVQRHNAGRERTTRPYLPFELIYSEEHADRITARIREKYLKSGTGKEFLKKLK
ncbi:MAG: endonuclease [Flavobacteriales bacterium]|nr:MAG: endonuclease [Flavobacteriales bacterium]